jgi:carbon storage regulator
MLVLSRKIGERIMIGDHIVVTVVKLDGSQVRLGIEAPQDIAIFREEIGPLTTHTTAPSVRPVV